MQMAAEFARYKESAWYWFYVYLCYAAAISGHEELKAKNSDFTEFYNQYFSDALGEAGIYDNKNKKKMGMPKL